MSTRSSERKPRLAAIAAVLTMALPFTSGITGAFETVSIPVPIGDNYQFNRNQVNWGVLDPGCNSDGTTCSLDFANDRVTVTASLHEETGERTAEAAIGYLFHLVPACDGQSTLAPFTIHFNYDRRLSGQSTTGGTTSNAATVRSTELGPGVPRSVGEGDGSGSGDLAQVSIDASTQYFAGTGARAAATLVDRPDFDDDASATSIVEPGTVQLDFHDTADPTFTYAEAVTKGAGSGTEFEGYYKLGSVELKARASDPTIASGVPVGQSCVDTIQIGSSPAQSVGPSQGEVRASVSGEGRHVTSVVAIDKAGRAKSKDVNLVIDLTNPGVDIHTKTGENGKNGWYMAPGATWVVECTENPAPQRDPEDISPCELNEISTNGGASWSTLTSKPNSETPTATGRSVIAHARSTDLAGNTASMDVSREIKVDVVDPVPKEITIPATGDHGDDWFRVNASFQILCEKDLPVDQDSGCGLVRTRVAPATEFTSTTTFSCSSDQVFPITWSVEDIAGNSVEQGKTFGCDRTPPLAVPGLHLQTPPYINPYNSGEYTNVNPVWKWTTGTDPTVNGASSGIDHYEITITRGDVDPPVVTTFSTTGLELAPTLLDGSYSFEIRSEDVAGNKGPITTTFLNVDRQAPTSTVTGIRKGYLYHNGQEIPLAPNGITPPTGYDSVVIGGITINLNALDSARDSGGYVSKLRDVQLIEDTPIFTVPFTPGAYEQEVPGNGDARRDNNGANQMCNYVNVASKTCSWTDAADGGSAIVPVPRRMYTRTYDNANSSTFSWMNYTKLDLSGIESICASDPSKTCTTLYWKAFDTLGTLAYQVQASGDSAFSTVRVVTTTAPGAAKTVTDTVGHVADEQTYYRVVVLRSSGQLTTNQVRSVGGVANRVLDAV